MNAAASLPGTRTEASGLRDLKGVLMRQRWTLLACLALGGAAGGVLVARARPVYEASALTRVEDDRGAKSSAPQQLDLAVLLGGGAGVGTDLEVLRTRTLAGAVVDSLGLRLDVTAPRRAVRSQVLSGVRVDSAAPAGDYLLQRDAKGGFTVTAADGRRIGRVLPGMAIALPGARAVLAREAEAYERIGLSVVTRDRAIRAMAGALDVDRPSREANILRLTYQSTDPVLARDVPNVLAARFVALRQEMHTTEARSTAKFLREQLDTLSAQLTTSERTLQAFQESSSVVDLETEGRTELTQAAQFQAERSAMATEHDALAALLRGADADAAFAQAPGAPSPYRRLAAFPSLMKSQTASELLASLTRLENERGALMVRRRATDPEVEALTARIQAIERELRVMADTYRGALAGQITSLDGHLSAARGRLDRIPARALQNARLSRQPHVLSQLYGLLQARLKEAEIAAAVENPSVRVIDPAPLPSDPVSPKKKLVLGGALMISLLVALGIGYLREFTDETVHTPGDLELALNAPVLALIPRLSAREQRRTDPLLPKSAPAGAALPGRAAAVRALLTSGRGHASSTGGSPAADAYDWLHTNLLFSALGREVRTVLVTSAIPGEGKTTTALNLARTMAERGERVLLIDADLRRGRIDAALGTPGSRGLADLVAGDVGIEDVLQEVGTEGGGLTCLTSGSASEHPTNLLRSVRARLLVQWAARKFDRVVIDSPPVHAVADAAVLAQYADGVVIVARSGVTPYGALANAAEQLQRAGAQLLGGVMNDVDFDRDARYDASYRWYGYGRDYYTSAN